MKKIELNSGQFALVSDEDFARTSKYSWYATSEGDTVVAKRTVVRKDGTRTTQSMHRFVSNIKNPRVIVSHLDDNGLNNQRDNLLRLDYSTAQASRLKRKGCVSKFKGVTKDGNRWRSRIYHKGRSISLGNFVTQKEAALAYNEKALEIYGDFATINQVR